VKFIDLSRFAPYLIPNEIMKAQKFEEGLNPVILDGVVGLEVKDFVELVGKAMKIEANLKRQAVLKEHNKRPLPSRFQLGKGQGSWNKRESSSRMGQGNRNPMSSQNSQRGASGVCSKCGRFHTDNCFNGNMTCFHCRKMGHIFHGTVASNKEVLHLRMWGLVRRALLREGYMHLLLRMPRHQTRLLQVLFHFLLHMLIYFLILDLLTLSSQTIMLVCVIQRLNH